MHRGLAVSFSSLATRLTTALVVRPAHASGAVPGVSKSPAGFGSRPRRASMPPNKRARPASGASPPASPATPGKATAAKRSRPSRPGVSPPAASDSSVLSFGEEVRDVRAALAAMSDRDPVLAGVIAEAGVLPRIAQCQTARVATHEPHRAFRALARAIVFQQLHGAAAATIFARLAASVGAEADATRLSPEAILSAEASRLRACGLSQRKLEYLRGLAEAFTSAPEGGGLGDAVLESATDEDAREAGSAARRRALDRGHVRDVPPEPRGRAARGRLRRAQGRDADVRPAIHAVAGEDAGHRRELAADAHARQLLHVARGGCGEGRFTFKKKGQGKEGVVLLTGSERGARVSVVRSSAGYSIHT